MNTMDYQSAPNVPPDRTAAAAAVSAGPDQPHGSRFHTVIDEQLYAELPPTPEEQQPRRARQVPDPAGQRSHPDDPAISVGPS